MDLIDKYSMKKINKHTSGGQAVIMSVLFFIILSGVLIGGVTIPTANQIKSANEAYKARQSYLAADSANDDALYRLNQGWILPSSFVLPFSDNVTSQATVTTNAEGALEINVVGDSGVPSRASKSVVSNGTGISLNYSAQIGTGGIELSSGTINGSVYSNGNIVMLSPAAIITGSATVANSSYPSLDQTNSNATTYDVEFGKTSALQDVAQGFQVSTTSPVSFLRVYIKKTGNVGNITVRIVSNSGSNPSGTTLASQTINASNVASSFGYVPVTLSNPVTLTEGVQYWLVLDYGTNHNSRFYTTKVTDNTYANGVAKRGSWSSSTGGTWNTVTPTEGDLVFELYAGGTTNKITGAGEYNRIEIGTGGVGHAWAYEVTNANIAGNAYCEKSSYIYNLSNGAVKNCISQSPAPVLDYPISSANISEWKAVVTDAVNGISGGWEYTGNLTIGWQGTTTTSLKRVNGNLTINGGGDAVFNDLYVTGSVTVTGGATLTTDSLYVGGNLSISSDISTVGATKVAGTTTVTGGGTLKTKATFWSVGMITLDGGSHIQLDSSVGSADGIIMSENRIDTSGGGDFAGSGTSGSYIMIISESDCPGNCGGGANAINLNGGSGAVAVFAPYGTVLISGGSSLKQVTAEKLIIQGGSSVTYEEGLADIDIGTGPSSGWVVESWDEVGQ